MDKLAPIVLFCYNRPEHLRNTMDALAKNDWATESEIIIYSDGAKNEQDQSKISEVRYFLQALSGFRKVTLIERASNIGLAYSVIQGVTEVIQKFGKVIVLEDDLITAPGFLRFMNQCLFNYKNNQDIFSVSGYTPQLKNTSELCEDVYLFPRISSWGWATWADRWESVDWEVKDFSSFIRSKEARKAFNKGGENLTPMLLNQQTGRVNSWAIRFSYAAYQQEKYCLYPRYSLIHNIGADGSGTHVKKTDKFQNTLYYGTFNLPDHPKIFDHLNQELLQFHQTSFIRRMINFIKRQIYLLKYE